MLPFDDRVVTSPPVSAVSTTERDDPLAVLLVDIGDLRCGIPASDVTALHPVVATVALPGSPRVVDGAIDLRGSIVAVLDVRARLGLPRRDPVLSDHLVVAHVGSRTVALRVDRAVDIVAIPRQRITEAEHLPYAQHLSGIARLADGLVLIHDLATFLSAGEAAALDDALGDARSSGRDGGRAGQNGRR